MAQLNIVLLGGFEVTLDAAPITTFGTDKTRALLTYLVVESDRYHSRSSLAALLWPELAPTKAAHNLSQTLLRLRKALPETQSRQPFLLIDSQQIRFNPLSDYRLDTSDFLKLLNDYRQHSHENNQLCRVCLSWLQQAVDLYRGDFLAGFSLRDSIAFEEWQLMEQEILHGQIIEGLTHLVNYYEQQGESDSIQRYASRLVALDPWQERPQLQLITALAKSGQIVAALAQYETYQQMLKAEFGLAPSPAAQALYHRIQNSRTGNPTPPGNKKSVPSLEKPIEHHERRQVTALVCTRYNPAGLDDPEEQIELLTCCREHCTPILEQYGGRRQSRQGTECLIYFGYPQTQEDAALRAARAALALQKTTHDTGHLRIGIHTGIMIAGDGELIGDIPNLAAACQRLADPNSIWITAATEPLLQGRMTCRQLGLFPLSNSVTLQLYRLIEENETHNRLEWLAQLHRLPPFVGREVELTRLTAALHEIWGGQGAVIAINGEPGIGKSRLIWELHHQENCPDRWFESSCSLYFQNTSLFPIVRLVEQLLEFKAGDNLQIRRTRLENALQKLGMLHPQHLWLISLLLNLPTEIPAPDPITEALRQNIRESCLTLLSRYTELHPVVLIIEDLHWADPSTIAWLEASLDTLITQKCLVLLTYRPEFIPPWQPRPHLYTLPLGPLPAEQVDSLISQLIGDAAVPEVARRRAIALTDGNPLFIEELTRAMLETGPNPTASEIPTTLRDSLLARLDHIGAARETAGWAATLGREFAYPVLAAVVPYSESRLQNDLAALIEANLITHSGSRAQPLYTFRHSLIQKTAYESLLKRTRKSYHRHIAEIYLTRFPQMTEMQPEILAEHYYQAGEAELAADQWLKAARQDIKRGAPREALVFIERAREVVAPEDTDRHWQILTDHIEIYHLTGDREAELAQIMTMQRQVAETPNPTHHAEALMREIRYYNTLGDLPRVIQLSDEAIAAARAVSKLEWETRILCFKAEALLRMGDEKAGETIDAAIACGHATGDSWSLAISMGMRALHEGMAGDYARSARSWEQVLIQARQSNAPGLESRALSNLGAAYQYLGRFAEAQRALEEGIRICELINDRLCRAYNVVNLGGVMLLRGDLITAQRFYKEGLEEATALGDENLRAGMFYDLGWIAERQGDYAEATQYLETARQIYTELEIEAQFMEINARLAKCALGQKEFDKARAYAVQVWNYLKEQGNIAMEEDIPIHLALAEVFEAGEDQKTAREVIQAGYRLVMERAAQISEDQERRSFLENVPYNRAIVEWNEKL